MPVLRIIGMILFFWNAVVTFTNLLSTMELNPTALITSGIVAFLGFWLYRYATQKIRVGDPTFSPASFTDLLTSLPAFCFYGGIIGVLVGILIGGAWFANEPHASLEAS